MLLKSRLGFMVYAIYIVLAICLQHATSQTIVNVAVGSVANLTFPYIIQPDQLSCSRNSSSSITFTGRYGKVVDNTTGFVNFTISSVQREDYGPYTCQSPTVGQFMTYSIVVADNLTLTVSPQTLLQVKDLVNITCKATFSIQSNLVLTKDQVLALYLDVGTTNIQKDDAELTTQDQSLRSRNLTYVGNVTEEMKRSNITCRLSSINPPFSTNVSVMANVAYAPLNVTIANDTGSSNNVYNANEMLLCYAKGNPPPTVMWLLVSSINNCVTSETITGSGSAILNLSPNCLGYQTWNCTSTYQLNPLAPANVTFKTFSFNVVGDNKPTDENTDRNNAFVGSNIVVLVNSAVELECYPDISVPGYKAKWKFGERTVSGNRYTEYEDTRNAPRVVGETLGKIFGLRIIGVTGEDSGLYTCQLPRKLLIDGSNVQLIKLTVSDECPDGYWACANGLCINASSRCDGLIHCADRSDEMNCGGKCSKFAITCSDDTCISVYDRCDTTQTCLSSTTGTDCVPKCFNDEFICNSGECIPSSRRCDGNDDCSDKSDEKSCDKICEGQFVCANKRCINMTSRCDGVRDCLDGADERGCNSTCQTSEFTCLSGECVSESKICDEMTDCRDESDEKFCGYNQQCPLSRLRCESGECLPDEKFCDGFYDCLDGSDEKTCALEACAKGYAKCFNGACYELSGKCDGVSQCSDGTDEMDCPETCTADEFKCKSVQMCFDRRSRCDGRNDCPDGSDEDSCFDKCPERTFKCNSGECLPNGLFCNGVKDCADNSDETGCGSTCQRMQYRCDNGNCLNYSVKCDGVNQCGDWSDERDCAKMTCSSFELVCDMNRCFSRAIICDGRPDCMDGSDENNCTYTTTKGYYSIDQVTSTSSNRSDVRVTQSETTTKNNCPSKLSPTQLSLIFLLIVLFCILTP